ncbi:MAG: hypothetical protein N2255_06815, partial [Kiritimatiellae bacterium]|nr:hypothetical protein [Kiritimatiellia bacterium]
MKTRPQWVSALIAGRLTAMCATLEVGPGKQFERVGAALAAAKDGDVIEVAAGDYVNEWLKIRQNNLTIRGVGSGRARFVSTGMIDNGKGIFVVSGNNLTVENLEFVGARVRDCNGAGIRPEGSGLVVRNCRFYDCEDGIQGGSGEILIEHCAVSYTHL